MPHSILSALLLLGLVSAGPAADPGGITKVLIDLVPGTTAWTAIAGGGRVTGTVPAGWMDDTAWAKTWVDYSQLSDDGRPFWRIAVAKIEEGRGQLNHPLPLTDIAGVYRLTANVRAIGLGGLEMGIRQKESPYAWIWKRQPAVTGMWQKVSWTLRQNALPGPAGEVAFYAGLDGLGNLDIAGLRLEYWTLAGFQAMTADVPSTGAANLLRITRAPLGLPPGWSLDRDNSDDAIVIATDDAVTGPSMAPALRLVAPAAPAASAGLWCGAVAVRAGSPHVASLWVRGHGEGALQVFGDGKQCAETHFTIDGDHEWKRIETVFDPVLLAQHALHLSFTGELWIDALQVERGTSASAFAAPKPCEIALHHASPGLLQFTPEVDVEYAALGNLGHATFAVAVSDVYGRHTELPAQPLAAHGTLHCPQWSDRPYGPLRIEATVLGADGAAISCTAEIIVNRLPQPRHWGEDAPDSPFGLHTNSTKRHNLMAKAIGANWVRGHDAGQYTTWFQLEPVRGTWLWQDRNIQRFREQHLMILGMLSTAPRWASTVGEDHEGYFEQYYQPKDLAAWQTYVTTVAGHYRTEITAWEVWNEPFGDMFWHIAKDHRTQSWVRGPTAPADYVRILDLAYAAVKKVDPALQVVGFCTNAGLSAWTIGVRDAGGLPACDIVSYHQYEAPQATLDDRAAKGFLEAIGPLVTAGGKPPKPVWMTEGNPIISCISNGMYRQTVPIDPSEDVLATADRSARCLVSMLARGVRKIFLYSMHAQTYFGGASEYAVILGPDGYLHPSATAYAACAWRLEDTVPAGIHELVPGVTAFAFQGRGRAVVVLAPQPGHAEMHLHAGITVADVYGNPVPANFHLGSQLVYVTADGVVQALLDRLH
jgi:hypothetical protein